VNTTIEIDQSVEEDDEGNEVVVEDMPAEVNIPIEKKIEVDEQWNLVIDGFVVGLCCTHA
jgi:hypothetical protein